MPNSKQIVYLSQAQYAELIANGSITVDGVTVNYNENDIYVTPQAEPVTDVRVGGTSVAANGVANVPVASVGKAGAFYTTDNGFYLGSGTQVQLNRPTDGTYKTGADEYRVMRISQQYLSTFYGLAKAAGHDEASSTESVGTYTPEAKAAIQSMLGVSDLIAIAENNLIASKAYKVGDVFTANGKLYKATAAIAQDAAIIPEVEGEEITGANCEETSVGEGFPHDVQVNGVSVVNNGVANIPTGTGNRAGVVQGYPGGGTQILADGRIMTYPAEEADIKAGTHTYRAIAPRRQDQSVFYGLAKAAGADEKDSTLPVGQYTDTAKTAIRTMLGATSSNVIAVQDTQPTDTDTKIWLPETAPEGVEVPTMADMNTALAGKVGDVQVNGTSVVSNGVANIPISTGSANGTPGLISIINYEAGLYINSNNHLSIVTADSSYIKAGTNSMRSLVPLRQHEAVFYGLAKAAGDTTQTASDNAVGQYTNSAKAAIKNMLGITHTLTVTVLTQDNVTVTGQTVTVRADDANGEVYATAAYEGQPVSFSVPDGFQYYVSVSDTLAHHFNPTTASGIITNTDVSVTLQYSDFSTIRSARDIKAALNAGLDLTDLVGEQITCTKNSETLTWDVADYDATNGRVTLLLHDAFGTANMVFEPAQALMWCENGLAAGAYTFTWNTTQCYFTLTTAIPAGGQLRATNSQFQTYASQDATATLETGTVSTEEITGATDLGQTGQGLLNHHDRVNYGSNNQAESAIQWWLNSDAPANTLRTPVTKFSRAFSYSVPGFMNGLDSDFLDCLDIVDWLCSTNNVYECPETLGGLTKSTRQTYTIKSKFCFASEMEIFGSYGGNADGSTVFDLYNGADADDRKKYRGTSAQVWWLRSPYWYSARSERYVGSSGGASYYNAISSCAVVPACQISRDEEDET